MNMFKSLIDKINNELYLINTFPSKFKKEKGFIKCLVTFILF